MIDGHTFATPRQPSPGLVRALLDALLDRL